jgi:hypothetical protein
MGRNTDETPRNPASHDLHVLDRRNVANGALQHGPQFRRRDLSKSFLQNAHGNDNIDRAAETAITVLGSI